MTINFHDSSNRYSYTARSAHQQWSDAIAAIVDVKGKKVIDIGCGGGIYSRAMLESGAAHVTGVDFSAQMLDGAKRVSRGLEGLRFHQADACRTGLPDQSADIILERALIHHLDELAACFREAFRLLKPGGTFLVQDRTPEDCLLPGSVDHLRGYFFEAFPRLAAVETARRHSEEKVKGAMQAVGFFSLLTNSLWEVRREYANASELRDDLLKRTGRSLLHELSDRELAELADYVADRLRANDRDAITERDHWTIWAAIKPY